MSRDKHITVLHRLALSHCDMAVFHTQRGDAARAAACLTEAFVLESRAANLLAADHDAEPCRSDLFRHAISLAFACNKPEAAAELARTALTGKPAPEVAEELQKIYGRAQNRTSGVRRIKIDK